MKQIIEFEKFDFKAGAFVDGDMIELPIASQHNDNTYEYIVPHIKNKTIKSVYKRCVVNCHSDYSRLYYWDYNISGPPDPAGKFI